MLGMPDCRGGRLHGRIRCEPALGGARNNACPHGDAMRPRDLAFLGLVIGCSAVRARTSEPSVPCVERGRALEEVSPSPLERAATRAARSTHPDSDPNFARALESASTPEILSLIDHASGPVQKAAVSYSLEQRPHAWKNLVKRSATRQDLTVWMVDRLCPETDGGADRGASARPTPGRDAFLLALAGQPKGSELRGRALACVARARPSEARALALEWLNGSDPALTRYAVVTLGRANALFEVDRLIKLANGADPTVVRASFEALGRITSPPAAAALLKLAREAPEDAARERAWQLWLLHPERRTGTLSPAEARRTLSPLVTRVLGALRQKNLDTLVRLSHPERGLRFGLCGQWVPSALYPAQLRGLLKDQSPKSWGGSCSPDQAELAFEDYLEHLTGFQDAPVVGYNTWLRSSSKDPRPAVEPTERAFPDGVFVELAWPEGRDGQTPWESLVLVFALFSEQYRLVGLLHAQAPPRPETRGVHVPPAGEFNFDRREAVEPR
jgi:hypothetical protein